MYDFILKYNEYIENIFESSKNDDIEIYTEFKNKYIIEGLIHTQDIEKSIRIIQRKFTDIKVSKTQDIEILMDQLKLDLTDYLPIINNLGYFVSRKCINKVWYNYIDPIIGNISSIIIEPKFDLLSETPPILYHVTLSKNNKSISTIGLIPKSNNKKTTHPERIYFTKDFNVSIKLSKILYKDIPSSDISIWEINTNGLDIKLYEDINFKKYGFYILSNIPPTNLKLIK